MTVRPKKPYEVKRGKIEKVMLSALLAFVDEECESYTVSAGCEPVDARKQFGFIPIDTRKFMFLLAIAKDVAKGNKFIDAGCGPGFTLKLAAAMGLEASGVEINPNHIKYAVKRQLKVMAGDMHAVDYRPYDIVYSYTPLTGDGYSKWSENVSFEAQPGTVFISPSSVSRWRIPKNGTYEMIYDDKEGMVVKKIKH